MYMYNLSVLVEEWLDGTVYDSYLGASEEIDLAAAQVENHMRDFFSTDVHEQVAMPPKMKLGLLKVGVTWFPQGCSDSWSSQGCSDSWSSQGCCDWEKNLGHWLPTTVAGSCSPGKVFIFTESPSFIFIFILLARYLLINFLFHTSVTFLGVGPKRAFGPKSLYYLMLLAR